MRTSKMCGTEKYQGEGHRNIGTGQSSGIATMGIKYSWISSSLHRHKSRKLKFYEIGHWASCLRFYKKQAYSSVMPARRGENNECKSTCREEFSMKIGCWCSDNGKDWRENCNSSHVGDVTNVMTIDSTEELTKMVDHIKSKIYLKKMESNAERGSDKMQ